MAVTDEEMFLDQIEDFEDEWYRFQGMLADSEQASWDVLVNRAKNRPYPAHCQLAAVDVDPKSSIVFTMLITQPDEIGPLREEVQELHEQVEGWAQTHDPSSSERELRTGGGQRNSPSGTP